MNSFENMRHADPLRGTGPPISSTPPIVDAQDVIQYSQKCLKDGNLLEAESAAIDLLRRYPEIPEAILIRARVHQLLGENGAAVSILRKFSSFDDLSKVDRVEYHLAFGLALRSLGQPEKSNSEFQKAISTDSSDCRPYLHLANLLRLTNDPDQAALIIERGQDRCRQTEELEMFAHILADWPRA